MMSEEGNYLVRTAQKAAAMFIAAAILVTMFDLWPVVNEAVSHWPNTNVKTDTDDHKVLRLIIVRNHPGKRSQTDINYRTASGGITESDALVGSGRWIRTVSVPRKDMLSLRAFQPSNGDLHCRIEDLRGNLIDDNARQDTGSIRCYYNRR